MKHLYLVDIGRDKSGINQYLSNTLLTKIENNLAHNKKTLLYLNKRGEYELLICQDCNNIEKCPKCDIALTIHKNPKKLVCHHCSYSKDLDLSCVKCNSTNLKQVGVGTEQIENALKKYFPNINIFRMDSDNVKNVSEKRVSLENMQNAQIIIGTKMITTGFDFSDIGLIGVILIEQELQIAKYDVEEKIYSNIKQLIGRGGRQGEETDIIIQTYAPNNEMIQNIINLNYKDFFKKTLEERKVFNYPPFVELAYLRYKNKDKQDVLEYIEDLYQKLKLINLNQDFDIIKLDSVYKRDNQYFGKILIKGNNIRDFLKNIKKDLFREKDLVLIF